MNTILRYKILLIDEKKYFDVMQEILRTVIRTLFAVYHDWIKISYPYQDTRCRKLLLECSWLFVDHCPPNIAPPLETAIAVFSHARRLEKSTEITMILDDLQRSAQKIMDSKLYQFGILLSKDNQSKEYTSISKVLSKEDDELEVIENIQDEKVIEEKKVVKDTKGIEDIDDIELEDNELFTVVPRKPTKPTAEKERPKKAVSSTVIELIIDSDDED